MEAQAVMPSWPPVTLGHSAGSPASCRRPGRKAGQGDPGASCREEPVRALPSLPGGKGRARMRG
jgi:hypothetical protein